MKKKSCHKCKHLKKDGFYRRRQQWKCLKYKGNERLSGFPFNKTFCHGFGREE